jgi:ABC-2 type transport system permease protein
MKMNNENDLKNTGAPQTEEAQENITSVETEPAQADAKNEKKEKKSGNNRFKQYVSSTRFRRGSISTAFTVGFLAIVILINVIVGILGERYPSMNLDLTKKGMNTLSEQTVKIVDSVKSPVKIYILATESQTKNDQILSSYGIQYSQVGSLAAKIAERNSNIKVEYIDLAKNPTFATKYKSENIQEGDVVIESEKRNRVLSYTELFDVQYSQSGMSTDVYSKVDSAFASGLSTVTAESLPVVAFDTGHSEKMDDTLYKSLLNSNNFETKDFNLLTDAIPDKTQLIVLGCPSTDYTDSEIKKLSDFLGNTELAGDRTLMVTFHPSVQEMPKLSSFLKEWGIEVVPQAIVVESDQSKYFTNDPSYILSNLQSEVNLGSNKDYGYFTTPQSNPINLVFDTQGNKRTYVLAKSNDTCYVQTNETKQGETPDKKASNTAVLSQAHVQSGDKSYNANVVALGAMTFSSDILSASTFGNSSYLVDLSRYATGTSNANTEVVMNPVQTNVADITLSKGMGTLLGFGVFTVLVPLLIAIAGICVFNKRRNL